MRAPPCEYGYVCCHIISRSGYDLIRVSMWVGGCESCEIPHLSDLLRDLARKG